jgi:hypothetical protein
MNMRALYHELHFAESTELEFRWEKDIDGANFELEIPPWRVSQPTPQTISVKVYDATSISASRLMVIGGQFSPRDMELLEQIGHSPQEGVDLPLRDTPIGGKDNPIVSAVERVDVGENTVRYRPLGNSRNWVIGETSVPISQLADPYPERLILLVESAD